MARPSLLLALGFAVTAIVAEALAATPASASEPNLAAAQARLAWLGYLPAGRITGRLDDATRQAVMAFQGWESLQRSGILGPATQLRLARAHRPLAGPGSRSRIEIDLSRQVALLVRGGAVLRAIHVSSGKSSTPTPTGRFRVFRKEQKSWSAPFRVWLPWASYFTGGIALHEFSDVPAFPASHGCVRIPASDAPAVYAFARVGTPVDVVG